MSEEDAKQMEKSFCESSSVVDDGFGHFLETRPPKISMSMLKSQKVQAKRQEQERQSLIHSEVAAQREAVTTAQWNFFKSALRKDQMDLSKVQQIPSIVKAKLHQKAVLARKQQVESGQKATQGYQDRSPFFRSPVMRKLFFF